ncbi:hypothetical protein ACFQ4O_03875 [Methylopila musalis]|uniref:Uncharacterized protein n=1 Tax=Methylopila musalis TaxID=1134781 RepID=A0ABW3Z5B2_9HYPH
MTALAHTVSAVAGAPAALLARVWVEIQAFFEEAHAANVRTGREEPFGL